jgi:hypothetical protein
VEGREKVEIFKVRRKRNEKLNINVNGVEKGKMKYPAAGRHPCSL